MCIAHAAHRRAMRHCAASKRILLPRSAGPRIARSTRAWLDQAHRETNRKSRGVAEKIQPGRNQRYQTQLPMRLRLGASLNCAVRLASASIAVFAGVMSRVMPLYRASTPIFVKFRFRDGAIQRSLRPLRLFAVRDQTVGNENALRAACGIRPFVFRQNLSPHSPSSSAFSGGFHGCASPVQPDSPWHGRDHVPDLQFPWPLFQLRFALGHRLNRRHRSAVMSRQYLASRFSFRQHQTVE